MVYTPKAVIDKPSDFLYVGSELEVELRHGDGALGFGISGLDRFFTVAVDGGPFKSVSSVQFGLADDVARDFILALNVWAASTGLIKPKAW